MTEQPVLVLSNISDKLQRGKMPDNDKEISLSHSKKKTENGGEEKSRDIILKTNGKMELIKQDTTQVCKTINNI